MKKILLALLVLAAVGCGEDETKVEYNSNDTTVVKDSVYIQDSVKTIEIDSTYKK